MTGRVAAAIASLLALFFATALSAQSAPRRPAPAAAADRTAPTIPASIAIKAAFAALDESISCNRPETLYLTVANEGTVELVVRSVTLRAPSDLQLCPLPDRPPVAQPDSRFSTVAPDTHVAAGRRAVVALPVGTRETPRPGTVPLLVEVELGATIGGLPQVDTLLAADQVELRIPGLSDVLRLFGVPTLFLLPGVLVFTAFAAARSGWDIDRLTAPTTPSFWALAIMISIAGSFAYATVAHGLGYARDLYDRFNLTDVAFVWFISLIAGSIAGLWFKSREARATRERDEAAKQVTAAQTLKREDRPLELLRKLVQLEIHGPLHWYAAGSHEGFLAEPGGSQRRWLIPQAEAQTLAGMPKTERDSLNAEFDARIGAQSSVAELIAALEDPKFAALMPLVWRAAGAPHELGPNDDPKKSDDDYQFIFRD